MRKVIAVLILLYILIPTLSVIPTVFDIEITKIKTDETFADVTTSKRETNKEVAKEKKPVVYEITFVFKDNKEDANQKDINIYNFFTEEEVDMICKVKFAEANANSTLTIEEQKAWVWLFCNCLDDDRWPDTVSGLIYHPSLFYGYLPYTPVTIENKTIVEEVLKEYLIEREYNIASEFRLPKDYVQYCGDGTTNYYRTLPDNGWHLTSVVSSIGG